jgi:hypothetical protein
MQQNHIGTDGSGGRSLGLSAFARVSERAGIRLGRYDASHEPAKVKIQTLFHGNTKDEDQISVGRSLVARKYV